MNWGEIKAEIRREMKDYGGDDTAHWSNDILLRRANTAQREIARETRCVITSADVSLVAGTGEYAKPQGLIDVVRITVDGKKLVGIDVADLDIAALDGTFSTSWTTISGTPQCYYESNDGIRLGFFPIPNSDQTAKCEYALYPKDMEDDSDYPLLIAGRTDDMFPDAAMLIVYFVCWLCALESDERKAMVYRTMFERDLASFKKAHNYKPDKLVAFSLVSRSIRQCGALWG